MTDAADPGAVLAHLRAHQDDMVELLGRLVAIESPSTDPVSQLALWETVAAELDGVGFAPRPVRATGVGRHLFARTRDRRRGRPRQLLLGHLDTVWPVGALAGWAGPVDDDTQRFAGPGAFDMKGGIVQMLWALRALRDLAIEPPVEPVVFVNSDEEIGSPDSRRWVLTLARLVERVFVLEGAAGLQGALKVGRKGVGRYVVRAKGRAAHAGLDPQAGASAVLEISHQIQHLFALNDLERGITVNVGTVDGGMRPNVVAPEARAEVDVRVYTAEDARAVDEAIRALEPAGTEVAITVEGGFGRPPMERSAGTDALWHRAQRLAGRLGIDVDAAVVGGASDGNLTSQLVPTLDGLGAVGDGAHRPDEHVVVATLPERAALLALLLAEPPLTGPPAS